MFPALSHPGGVDQKELLAIALVGDVHGVARRAGKFTHDRARTFHDRVNQR